MIKITLKGEPKSTNNIYRSTCRGKFATVYMSTAGKELKESYVKQAKEQYEGSPTGAKVKVDIKLYFKADRKHDIDNFNKLILDSLTKIIWKDDVQIKQLSLSKDMDRENPRAEIEISKLLIVKK